MPKHLIYDEKTSIVTSLPGNAFETALKRIHWIYEEFDGHVTVSMSGGKDSTVVMELAALVCRQRGKGEKVRVMFLDQEAEYQATIDYIRHLRDDRDDIEVIWYQIPFKLFNATSYQEEWSYVWDERLTEDQWMRPKEPDSIKVNDFYIGRGDKRRPVDRFKDLLTEINKRDGGVNLTGMRAEESPTRRVFLTARPTYKWVTWASGKPLPGQRLLMHPIYDWSYRDIWKAMHTNGWRYNTFYDAMFQYGVKLLNMRVSSFHHEQSQQALSYLQEIEPATWEKATQRLTGISTYGHVGKGILAEFASSVDISRGQYRPYMFDTWFEYYSYLVEHLVASDEDKKRYNDLLQKCEWNLPHVPRYAILIWMVYLVISNDVYGSKVNAWLVTERHTGRAAYWAWWLEQRKKDGSYSQVMVEEEGRINTLTIKELAA